MPFFEQHKSLFRNPKKLADVVASLNADSEYAAIFVPGGHGALIGLPESEDVAAALQWAIENDRFVISYAMVRLLFWRFATAITH